MLSVVHYQTSVLAVPSAELILSRVYVQRHSCRFFDISMHRFSTELEIEKTKVIIINPLDLGYFSKARRTRERVDL